MLPVTRPVSSGATIARRTTPLPSVVTVSSTSILSRSSMPGSVVPAAADEVADRAALRRTEGRGVIALRIAAAVGGAAGLRIGARLRRLCLVLQAAQPLQRVLQRGALRCRVLGRVRLRGGALRARRAAWAAAAPAGAASAAAAAPAAGWAARRAAAGRSKEPAAASAVGPGSAGSAAAARSTCGGGGAGGGGGGGGAPPRSAAASAAAAPAARASPSGAGAGAGTAAGAGAWIEDCGRAVEHHGDRRLRRLLRRSCRMAGRTAARPGWRRGPRRK